MNIQQVEEYMHQRIRLFLANGGRLERGVFFGSNNCRCAISACTTSVIGSSSAIDRWAKDTGLTVDDAWAVINGFDGNDPNSYDPVLYDLGKRLAAEYL